MITFALHGYEGVDPAHEFGPLKAEFQRRGFPCIIVRSPHMKTKTPNQDRAKVMVEALRDIEGDVALVGISNQGLFMPLVAAARPIRRIVFINGVIPRPGKSFWETEKEERVFASWARVFAWLSPGMHEVCQLSDLPKVEYVCISAEHDEEILPEWEQRAAREFLHVEPIVIAGAGHSDIVSDYVSEVVDAATLQPQKRLQGSRPPLPHRRKHSVGQALTSFAISHFVPLVTYFAVRPHVANDTQALAIAWFIPLAWTLGSSLWRRRLEIFGLAGIFVYGLTLSISIFFGAGTAPLKLHRAVMATALGLVCLISVAIRQPVFVLLARLRAKVAGGSELQAALANPKMSSTLRGVTLIIGIACLGDAALQTALAITLSTARFLVATTVIHIAAVIGMATGVILYVRFRQ